MAERLTALDIKTDEQLSPSAVLADDSPVLRMARRGWRLFPANREKKPLFMSFLRSISTLRFCWPGHLNLVDAQRTSLPSSACQFTRTVIGALARPTGAASSSRFPSGAISNASGLFAGVGGS